jgi:hypothetical protein
MNTGSRAMETEAAILTISTTPSILPDIKACTILLQHPILFVGTHTDKPQKVDGSSHRILLAGGPGLHTIQEAYFNLLITTSNQMTDHLQRLSDKASAEKHHETSSGHHGTTGTFDNTATSSSPATTTTGSHGPSGLVR